jgi:hypothetical protein
MNRGIFHLLTITCSLIVSSPIGAAEPALDSHNQQVLLLKNQQILTGKITSLGDYTHVAMGNSADVRIPKKDVWLIGHNIEDVYQQRLKLLRSNRIEDRLSLADWCIRQKLPAQAAEQLVQAMQIDARDPRIEHLEKKLQVAIQPESSKNIKPTAIAATVGHEQLERIVHELPHGALERFAIVVQPIVMDRCGAGRCHGSSSDSNFQIVQPTASRVPSRRFTQRNLFAVMSLMNTTAPLESELLKKSLEPHGGHAEAPLKNAEDRQYQALKDWVLAVAEPTVDKNARPLSVANRGLAGPQRQMSADPETSSTGQKPASALGTPALETTRDPFDPESFNSKYHAPR